LVGLIKTAKRLATEYKAEGFLSPFVTTVVVQLYSKDRGGECIDAGNVRVDFIQKAMGENITCYIVPAEPYMGPLAR
jgi:hypothetical protein